MGAPFMWNPFLPPWQRVTLSPARLPVESRRSFEVMAEIYLLALILQLLAVPFFYLTQSAFLGHLNLLCVVAYGGALWLHRCLWIATALGLKLGAFLLLVAYAHVIGVNDGALIYYLLFAEVELMLSGLRRRTKVIATAGLMGVALLLLPGPAITGEALSNSWVDILVSQVGVMLLFVMLGTVILRTLSITDRHELRYRRDAMQDSLTLIFNRRAVHESARRLWHDDGPFSLVLIDADRFKEINDRHGHPAGDAVLRHLAELLRDSVRDDDVVGRVGGEEFLVLLPRTTLAGATAIARRLRERLARAPCHVDGQALAVTLSMGIAQSEEADSLDDVIEIADRRLYAAKALGRDRVVADGEENHILYRLAGEAPREA